MEATSAKTLPFASSVAHQEAGAWITAYTQDVLVAKDEATIEAYTRILKRFAQWLSARPGNHDRFHPQVITRTAIEFFLDTLAQFQLQKAGSCRFVRVLPLAAGRSSAPWSRSRAGRLHSGAGAPCRTRVVRGLAARDPRSGRARGRPARQGRLHTWPISQVAG